MFFGDYCLAEQEENHWNLFYPTIAGLGFALFSAVYWLRGERRNREERVENLFQSRTSSYEDLESFHRRPFSLRGKVVPFPLNMQKKFSRYSPPFVEESANRKKSTRMATDLTEELVIDAGERMSWGNIEKLYSVLPHLSFEEMQRVKDNSGDFGSFYTLSKNGYAKYGFIFPKEYISGDSRFKDVYKAEAVFYDEERKIYRRKTYVLAAAKEGTPDFLEERLCFRRLFSQEGIRVMPDRLCDYSKGGRRATTISLDGRDFHIYKYYEEGTLSEKMGYFRSHRNETLNFSLAMLSNVLGAHQNGQCHTDIKPKNILLDDEFQPVLMDMTGSLEQESICYTPRYAPLALVEKIRRNRQQTPQSRKKVSAREKRLLDIHSCIHCFEEMISQNLTLQVQKKKGSGYFCANESDGSSSLEDFFNERQERFLKEKGIKRASKGKLYKSSYQWAKSDYGESDLFKRKEQKKIAKEMRNLKNRIEQLVLDSDEIGSLEEEKAKDLEVDKIAKGFGDFLLKLKENKNSSNKEEVI